MLLYVGNANEDGGSYYVKLDGSNGIHPDDGFECLTFTGKRRHLISGTCISAWKIVSDLTGSDVHIAAETRRMYAIWKRKG